MKTQGLTVRSIRATAVEVPMRRPLVTSVQTLSTAPLLLIDLLTQEGVPGHAYVFCYLRRMAGAVMAALAEAEAALAGQRLGPLDAAQRLQRHFRLVGATGSAATALASVDMALWDAQARAVELPLAALLGAQPRPVRAYNSCGLGMSPVATLADEAEALLDGGFQGVKIRLGRARLEDDLAAVRAVRSRLPDDVALMADFNQALSVTEAGRRCQALAHEGLYWIEEPIRHDDYAGSAALARASQLPIQIGENFLGPRAMARALAASASDFVMPDVERIGGVTGWLQAAALAAVHDVEISTHLMPEVSAHLLAASPTAHWLEYVDWADPVLRQPLRVAQGCAQIEQVVGNGLEWDEDAVAHYRFAP